MFARKTQRSIPTLVLILGMLIFAIRYLMNGYLRDSSGLLPGIHPLTIAVGVFTLAALVIAFYGSRTIEVVESYAKSFPASFPAFLGHFLAAAGVMVTVLTTRPSLAGSLALVWQFLGYATVVCLMAAGIARFRGQQPFFVLHLLPAVFLMIHAVSNYRTWSSEPQVISYAFSLLGIVCQLLFAFYHSAFDTGLEWRRRVTFFAYMSVVFGLAAVPGSGYPWLYLGCSLWALLDRPVPRLRRRRPRPFEEETK